MVEDVIASAKGVGPKGSGNGLGPMVFCVEKHSTTLFFKVPNATFGNAVLEVRVDPAISDALVAFRKAFEPSVIHEMAIVGVVRRVRGHRVRTPSWP